MDCHDADELLPGLVLDALTDDEQRAVDQHLATCDRHPQIDDYRRVAAALMLGVKPVPPPTRLKHQLMARVYRDLDPGAVVRPWQQAWAWAVAAVMAALALGLGVRNYAVSAQLASAPAQWQVQPAAAGVQTSGSLVYLPKEQTATLTLRQLPPLPAGDVYEVWLLKGSTARPAGVFRPSAVESASVIVNGQPSGYDTIAVTREPGPDGSPAPTSKPFVTGSLR
jgi:hypothetical protein